MAPSVTQSFLRECLIDTNSEKKALQDRNSGLIEPEFPISVCLVRSEGFLDLLLQKAEGLANFREVGEFSILNSKPDGFNFKIFVFDSEICIHLFEDYCFQNLVSLELPIKHTLNLQFIKRLRYLNLCKFFAMVVKRRQNLAEAIQYKNIKLTKISQKQESMERQRNKKP